MKVLILGGTVFLGRAITEAALAAGHEVTLFNRGKTGADLFPDVEKLRGDRDGGLTPLAGRKWDVVIDPSGYVPRLVRASAELLRDAVEHYTFISSISVYSTPAAGMDESAPLHTLADETVEEVNGETYGGLKVLCENVVDEVMPGRGFNVRAGLIVGPHDPTDRFTYWVVRASQAGKMLVPPLDAPLQVIDVRDLSAWIIRMAEARKAGTYNATGPESPLTFAETIAACVAAGGDVAEPVEVNDGFLGEQNIAPWAELPLWLPIGMRGMMQVSVEKAQADGLSFRPLDATIRDTLAWFNAERTGDSAALRSGLPHGKEQAALVTWG